MEKIQKKDKQNHKNLNNYNLSYQFWPNLLMIYTVLIIHWIQKKQTSELSDQLQTQTSADSWQLEKKAEKEKNNDKIEYYKKFNLD